MWTVKETAAGDVEIKMNGSSDATTGCTGQLLVVLVNVGGSSGLHHCIHGVSERIGGEM